MIMDGGNKCDSLNPVSEGYTTRGQNEFYMEEIDHFIFRLWWQILQKNPLHNILRKYGRISMSRMDN